jgi:hypothetical protein
VDVSGSDCGSLRSSTMSVGTSVSINSSVFSSLLLIRRSCEHITSPRRLIVKVSTFGAICKNRPIDSASRADIAPGWQEIRVRVLRTVMVIAWVKSCCMCASHFGHKVSRVKRGYSIMVVGVTLGSPVGATARNSTSCSWLGLFRRVVKWLKSVEKLVSSNLRTRRLRSPPCPFHQRLRSVKSSNFLRRWN